MEQKSEALTLKCVCAPPPQVPSASPKKYNRSHWCHSKDRGDVTEGLDGRLAKKHHKIAKGLIFGRFLRLKVVAEEGLEPPTRGL